MDQTFIWTIIDTDDLLLLALKKNINEASSEIKCTVKPVYNDHSKIDETKIFMTDGSLRRIESIAEWSILQYFWSALSEN